MKLLFSTCIVYQGTHSYYSIHEVASERVGKNAKTVTALGTSTTLGNQHSNSLLLLSATGGSAVALPAAYGNAGISFNFIVQATGGHSIAAPSAILQGCVPSCITTTTAISTGAGTVLRTTAGSTVGDHFTLTSSGAKWFVSGGVVNFNAAIFA